MKSLKIIIPVLVVLLVGGGLLYFSKRSNSNANSKLSIKAASSSGSISSDSDWQVGSLTEDEIVDVGQNRIKLNTSGVPSSPIDRSSATSTASVYSGDAGFAIDGDVATMWGDHYSSPPGEIYWIVDFHEEKNIAKTYVVDDCWGIYGACNCKDIYYGSNGTDFTKIDNSDCYTAGDSVIFDVTARYIKILVDKHSLAPPPDPHTCASMNEIDFYPPADYGTHTSGVTQITDANFWQWQTFSPTYTEPANTDISFKFRTSADGTTWNSWTASQTVASGGSLDLKPLVASWSGTEESPGTFYKYIQVETTMTNTDGASTPTLSDYSIGYHTNVAPGTPTALTAVVGE